MPEEPIINLLTYLRIAMRTIDDLLFDAQTKKDALHEGYPLSEIMFLNGYITALLHVKFLPYEHPGQEALDTENSTKN